VDRGGRATRKKKRAEAEPPLGGATVLRTKFVLLFILFSSRDCFQNSYAEINSYT
jgi:hypothetical protein